MYYPCHSCPHSRDREGERVVGVGSLDCHGSRDTSLYVLSLAVDVQEDFNEDFYWSVK